ncbi:MAG: hypothetical protein M1831_003724 [Alyxoria varia]|nr:MAG: hypothetical protein M1831_003724 [Alyxoria varia]
MSRNPQPPQPSIQRFPLDKFSQAVTQPGIEKTAVPWTHRTDKDLYWIIDDDHFSGNRAQGKIMKVVRGNETLIRRLQMRMKNETDFEAAMATLRSLGCPLQGYDARDGSKSRDRARGDSVGSRRASVQPGVLPTYQSAHGQSNPYPGQPQQMQPQRYPPPVENFNGYAHPGGPYDNTNRVYQPDTAFRSSTSTHSSARQFEGRPYTSPHDSRRPSTELMPPPQDLPLQAISGNQGTNSRLPGSSSPAKAPVYSGGAAVPSRHTAEPMDIERPSLSRDSMLNLPSETPQHAQMNQDPDYRPFTGISDRSIKTSGSNARGPPQLERDASNAGASYMPLGTVNDTSLNAMAGNRDNNGTVPKIRPQSSSVKPFGPDAAPGIPFDESRSSLQWFCALPEVEQVRQLDRSVRHWIHDDNFVTLCEAVERSPELRFGVENAVEERKDRNLGRGSFR